MHGLPSVLTSAALAVAAVSASAEVVMWYRFDELEPGEVAKDGKRTLVNKANPGTLDLTLYSYSGTTVGTDSSLMPVGTNSFGAALKVWDPLTGRYFENVRAMHFGARGAISGTAMEGSIAGSGTGTQPIFNQLRRRSFRRTALVETMAHPGDSPSMTTESGSVSARAIPMVHTRRRRISMQEGPSVAEFGIMRLSPSMRKEMQDSI